MKFNVIKASDLLIGKGEKEKKIRSLRGLKKFTEETYKNLPDMPDENEKIIISFKRKRIIIYNDFIE